MAYYLVSAKPITQLLPELEARLKAREFEVLKPFGHEILKALIKAKLKDGIAYWEEEDYCVPPLKEEKAAALDKYFTDIKVEKLNRNDGWKQIENLPRLFPDLEITDDMYL